MQRLVRTVYTYKPFSSLCNNFLILFDNDIPFNYPQCSIIKLLASTTNGTYNTSTYRASRFSCWHSCFYFCRCRIGSSAQWPWMLVGKCGIGASKLSLHRGPGLDFRQGKENFLFCTASRPGLGPLQPPIQWVTGALYLRLKWQQREAGRLRLYSVKVKNGGAIPLLPHAISWRSA
jgi:hypothetical protein